MVVVVIVGVLSSIGVMLFRNHVIASRANEALGRVQAIAGAQETWRAQHMSYLNVSPTIETLYPKATPDPKTVTAWQSAVDSPLNNNWRALAVADLGPVRFGYATVAGLGGSTPSAAQIPKIASPPAFSASLRPWYIIQAVGDLQGSGPEPGNPRTRVVLSSFSPEVYVENEGQ